MAVQQFKTGTGRVQQLGDMQVETVIKVNLDGQPTDFIVVQQGTPSATLYVGMDNATILLQKELYNTQKFSDVGSNAYEDSVPHIWLNDETNGYLSLLDSDIRSQVLEVKVPYRAGNSNENDSVSSGEYGLQTKVFLMSADEYNQGGYGTMPRIGKVFEYFNVSYELGNERRIATYNDIKTAYWTRNPRTIQNYGVNAWIINADGNMDDAGVGSIQGIRPVFCLPQSLYVLSDGTVTTNELPTAPGSIDTSGDLSGGSITITLTAATDPDGTVESYRFERQIDGGEWTQFADVNALTQTDIIGKDWGTVAYRACAVDDIGVPGPYVTSKTVTVNSGWVILSGPAEELGSKAAPFDLDFSVSISGVPSVDAITVSAARDGEQIYSGTPSAGEQISVPIDTRLLGAGQHAIEVQASKDDYLPGSRRYTFTVPAVAIPAGGTGEQAQGSDGRPVFHTTLAQRCIGTGGVDIQAQVDALTARVKTLEG